MHTEVVRIKKIRKVEKSATVCDIEVADNHNLFVCNEITQKPVLAHNCYYLKKLYGIEVVGWALVYIARDNPKKEFEVIARPVTPKQVKRIGKDLKRWDTHHDIVVRARRLRDVQQVIKEKPCKTLQQYKDRYYDVFDPCGLAQICFDPKKLERALRSVSEKATHLPITTVSLADFKKQLKK